MIFHLTSFAEWNKAQQTGEYTAPSLVSEGFIHLSTYGQILSVANAMYKSVELPILLVLDNNKMELTWEGEAGMEFPHLYRPIKIEEVVKTIPLLKDKNKNFMSSEELDRAASACVIETQRLLLRDFQLTDFESVHSYASNDDLVKYMPWGPNSPDETRAFLARKFKEQAVFPRKNFDLAVINKETGEFLGSCGIMVRSFENETAFIGYILRASAHGKGYATEFSKALIDFGFNTLKLHRIEATCDEDNHASFNVMLRSGMQKEGVIRESHIYKGKRRNTILCSVIRT